MDLGEIMFQIHTNGLEKEVFDELHKWILVDRANWIDRTKQSESTVLSVGKIANIGNSTALEDIATICEAYAPKLRS